jgi:hypothetical protein
MEKRLTADLNVVANSNLEIQLLDGDLNIIQKLDDEPNDVGGLTSAELKAKFDESGNIIKKYINETLIPAVLTEDATEESRKQAEAARVAAEQGRVTAEEGRVSAETARAAAEQARSEAESSRVSAENAREAAETARADETAGIVARATAQANAAAGSASQAAGSEQRAKDAAGTATGAASTASNAASYASQAAAAASGSASQAQASAAAAAQSAANGETANKSAQSWAVGGTGTRPGEDTNNAKYWAEHAEAVAGGDFATKVEALGYVTAHNESVEAHPDLRVAVAGSIRYDAAQSLTDEQKAQARGNINAAPGGFGLGGGSKVLTPDDDLNNIWEDGSYAWDGAPKNAPTVGGSLIPYCSMQVINKGSSYNMHQIVRTFEGYEIHRYYDGATKTWSEWAWANPPMMAGVEYRTTEFYLGKPVAKKISEGFEMWTAEGVPVWVSAGKPICYTIEAGGTRSIALPREATFLISCSDNVRGGVAIVQSAGGAITSITPIVPLNSWGIEAGSGLTVNVTEKDTRFGMTVKIMML